MNIYPAIADKIEGRPELLETAMKTLRHWREEKFAPEARLKKWEALISAAQKNSGALRDLLSLLRDESQEARRLKDFGPFAGILSREERRRVILSCGYDH